MPRSRAHPDFISRFGTWLIVAVVFCATSDRSDASDWMFRRSYYSHPIPPELAYKYPAPVSLSAYRPAVVGPYPGFSVQSIQRFNNVVIPSGASLDYTLLRSETVRQMP
ncbi:MAG: hypothetical protein M3552_22810 [Planctomycetota bacterium]|nr:hypothetical protein [Planctomycetaceae bacterium]MDQ3333439.1 hypothetical protein [Planctomycetota bacterium]